MKEDLIINAKAGIEGGFHVMQICWAVMGITQSVCVDSLQGLA
jgi:hypothetical protein